MKASLLREMELVLPGGTVQTKEPLCNHTSFKIGGPADLLAIPSSAEEIHHLISLLDERGVPFCVIGNGTNILVHDSGVKGVVIKIAGNLGAISIQEQGEEIRADAGAPLPLVAKRAQEDGLSGLEFAIGIPGTLGGGIRINAGAFGESIGTKISWVDVVDKKGGVSRLAREQLAFSYRSSSVKEENRIILAACITLMKDDPKTIEHKISELCKMRREQQPIDRPSAGSIFKKSGKAPAGWLIEKAGLKGLRAGGCLVSPRHANFIVNLGGGRSEDVINLIHEIRKKVFERFGVLLEPEIEILTSSGSRLIFDL